jgi:hypothetical protein
MVPTFMIFLSKGEKCNFLRLCHRVKLEYNELSHLEYNELSSGCYNYDRTLEKHTICKQNLGTVPQTLQNRWILYKNTLPR